MNTNGNGNGPKRAILYARVSTDDQAEKGYSLPSKFDAMRKYAMQQGFEIVAEYQDDYSGATPIEFRPEGGKAYATLKSNQADVIIAYTIDRFVRPPEDGDEWDMPVLIRGLAKLGKEIHTVRRGKLNTGFADLLIAMLDARKAGEERRDTRERSMRGKRRKVKEGKVIGLRAPYGYRHVRDEHGKVITLEIDETTARVVRLIFKWYASGDEHGKKLSCCAIAKRLSEMKVTVPGALQRGYHQRRVRAKTEWCHSTVRRILLNEVYRGTWVYGGNRAGAQTKRENWETVSTNVPAIVDAETWARAQAQRGINTAFSPRNRKYQYLLSGLIFCGLCGLAYVGTSSRAERGKMLDPRRRYYADTWRIAHDAKLEGRCASKYVRADAIEDDVWDEIRELFQDPDRLWDNLKRAQQSESDTLAPIREKLQTIEDFIRHAERDAAKIAAALPDAEKGGAVYKALKAQEIEVNTRLDSLAKQREKLIEELGARKLTDDAIDTIIEFARTVREGIDDATFEIKRRILESLDVRVTITPGQYHIKCILGEKGGKISQMKRGNVRIVHTSRTSADSRQCWLRTSRLNFSRRCTSATRSQRSVPWSKRIHRAAGRASN